MLNSKLIITCAYLENYSDNPNTKPYWKIKGDHIFEMELSSDLWLYAQDEVEQYINHSIAKAHNNEYCKYIPNSYEIRFDEPEQLPSMDMAKLNNLKKHHCLLRNSAPTRPQLSVAAQEHFLNNLPAYRNNIPESEFESYKQEIALSYKNN